MAAPLDAVIVGGGPNGLAAGITLARAGLSVRLLEASDELGGGARTASLTLPGFRHDVCSSVHPLGVASPFFRGAGLAGFGLEWVHPSAPLAHPFDDEPAALLERSVGLTASGLGSDRIAYEKVFAPLVHHAPALFEELLRPPLHLPGHPCALLAFARHALLSATSFADARFRTARARALCAGVAAHLAAPLDGFASEGVGLVLQLAAHFYGWPIARGGSGAITAALYACLRAHGGEARTSTHIRSLADLPGSRFVLFDLDPPQIEAILGGAISPRLRGKLRGHQAGRAVFKVDWALAEAIPWRDPACARAATVHLGPGVSDIAGWERHMSGTPFVLVTQPSLFDPSRAPPGKHVAWAYCHMPAGSALDQTDIIENHVERFAPGFRSLVLARSRWGARELEAHNPNLAGGDISGGSTRPLHLLLRPFPTLQPYALDGERYWICSSSTPPGPGVHGMCGANAARALLAHYRGPKARCRSKATRGRSAWGSK